MKNETITIYGISSHILSFVCLLFSLLLIFIIFIIIFPFHSIVINILYIYISGRDISYRDAYPNWLIHNRTIKLKWKESKITNNRIAIMWTKMFLMCYSRVFDYISPRERERPYQKFIVPADGFLPQSLQLPLAILPPDFQQKRRHTTTTTNRYLVVLLRPLFS